MNINAQDFSYWPSRDKKDLAYQFVPHLEKNLAVNISLQYFDVRTNHWNEVD